MNEAFIEHDRDGFHVYRHVGDRHKQRVGPAFREPAAAISYAKALDGARDISPIRATRSGDDTDLARADLGTARLAGTGARRRSGSPVEAHPPAPGGG